MSRWPTNVLLKSMKIDKKEVVSNVVLKKTFTFFESMYAKYHFILTLLLKFTLNNSVNILHKYILCAFETYMMVTFGEGIILNMFLI